MNKDRLCVGIDVGKDELVVATTGRPRSFGTSRAELKRLVAWIVKQSSGSPVHVGMEATGVYSRHVALFLSGCESLVVSVINPFQIKAFGRAMLKRTKTDWVDAQVIREFVRSQTPAAWTPPPPVRQELASLVAQVDAIGQEIRQWKNRRHAQSYDPHTPSTVTASTTAILDSLSRQRAQLDAEIDSLCASDAALAADVALLTSVKGIGIRSATQILAYGAESLTHRSRRQLDAHAGLAPAQRQSGSSIRGRSHLAKQGNARLRQALYMPTLVAVHRNDTLRSCYQRLQENGKCKKVALIACMRKLLNIIRAILIKRQPFITNYQSLT